MDNDQEVPGYTYDGSICTCFCHNHNEDFPCIHCAPCCDRTYQPYSDELWSKISELEAQVEQQKVDNDHPSLATRLANYKKLKHNTNEL